MNGEIENFEEVVAKGEKLYESLGTIYCPYFNEDVHFNVQGLEHLKFKHRGKARIRHDQYMRFKLLHLVPEIIRLSRSIQGIWETKHFERVRVHSRTDTILKPVTYYEFIAVLNNVRVKVVVKQVGGGQKFFWSLIPFWGINRETKRRKLYGGNPEED